MVARLAVNEKVAGSNPARGAVEYGVFSNIGLGSYVLVYDLLYPTNDKNI